MRQKIYKHSFNHIKDHAGLRKTHKQAGAELGQAQLPANWDLVVLGFFAFFALY